MTNVWNDLRHLASHAAISLLAIAAALSLGIAALALASCVWRLGDERLLAES